MTKTEQNMLDMARATATKYEELYNKEHNTLQDLKSFIRVRYTVADVTGNTKLASIYNEMLQYIKTNEK